MKINDFMASGEGKQRMIAMFEKIRRAKKFGVPLDHNFQVG